jgi:branched-chain amino acid transport system permease protein
MIKGRFDDENLKWIPVLIIVVFLFPFLLKSATFSYKYYLYILNIAGIYIILTVGLDILSGFTGLMSLGHAAFLAIGAYTSAILVDQVGLPFELSLIITPIIVGLFGFVIGFPALRIEGMYLGLTTMGFGFIVKRLIIAFREWTGGSGGLHVSKATFFGITINNDWDNYFMIYTFAILAIIIARRIVKSKLGRAFMAIRDSEQAAQASGINLAKYKMMSFFYIRNVCRFCRGIICSYQSFYINRSFRYFTINIIYCNGPCGWSWFHLWCSAWDTFYCINGKYVYTII